MSLLSQFINGLVIISALIIGIVILFSMIYLAGSMIIVVLLKIPAIPITMKNKKINFRGNNSILNYFNPEVGRGAWAWVGILSLIGLVIMGIALIGKIAAHFGVALL